MNAAELRAELLHRPLPPSWTADFIDACFEGGSASTGRLDESSDVDLYRVAGSERLRNSLTSRRLTALRRSCRNLTGR